MDELDKAIDKFYRAFADTPAPTKIGGCPCCIDDKEIQTLLTTPLRELTADDLSAYASSALLTVGSVSDYLYFLPRIMEISIRESWWPNIEVTGRAIMSTNLTSWPAPRREEIGSFLHTLIGHIVDTGSYWLIDDWFCAICRIELDIHPFLRIVEKNSDAVLEYWGANAKCLEVGKLCNAFWELPNHGELSRPFRCQCEDRLASGTGGTVIRTVDGGKTWKVMTVPGAEKLDFRDIEAFDANTAFILSIGNGESSRIYKTIDGGATWKLQFQNKNEKAFFDAIACWDKNNCIAMSDPVDGHYVLISTSDSGANWRPIISNKMPAAKDGEAAFAASGTCLIVQGKNNAFLVSGGSDARVFRSNDRGLTWSVSDTPIVKGTPGSGIFSIAMRDAKNGVIVGGNYEKPDEAKDNLAFTSDGGITWTAAAGLGGYRSGVAYLNRKSLIAVGTNGSDIRWLSNKDKDWHSQSKENLNSVQSDGKDMIWAVGPNGLVVRQFFGTITLDG